MSRSLAREVEEIRYRADPSPPFPLPPSRACVMATLQKHPLVSAIILDLSLEQDESFGAKGTTVGNAWEGREQDGVELAPPLLPLMGESSIGASG